MAKVTEYQDRQTSRDRQAHLLVGTPDGNLHEFIGRSIEGVLHAYRKDYTRNGKWSYSDWLITTSDDTFTWSFHECWNTGRVFPFQSWREAYLKAKQFLPLLKEESFHEFVRENYPETSARFDEAEEVLKQFGAYLTPEQIEALIGKLK